MSEELSEKQIDQIRREVAKAYHDLMIDLAMKGEGQVGRRRFWKNAENVIEWEDLPDDDNQARTDPLPGEDGTATEASVPAPAEPARRNTRAQRNRRAAVISGQAGSPEPKRRKGGGK